MADEKIFEFIAHEEKRHKDVCGSREWNGGGTKREAGEGGQRVERRVVRKEERGENGIEVKESGEGTRGGGRRYCG